MTDLTSISGDSGRKSAPRARLLAAVAQRQGGVVAVWQLLELGFSRALIEHWVKSGRLHPIHAGVYALGHAHLEWKGRVMAAVLACGRGAVLSHRSAAAWWGILPSERARVDVTATGRHQRRGIDCHTVRRLDRRDRTIHEDVPITTVARTLLDLAEVVPEHRLLRAIEQTERMRLLDMIQINDLFARTKGRRGLKPLSALLTDYRTPPTTRARMERDFLEFCREEGIPKPEENASVLGYEVDMLWPQEKVIVELDLFITHGTREAFERDRLRDADFQPEYVIVRVTERRLRTGRKELAAQLHRLLSLRASARP